MVFGGGLVGCRPKLIVSAFAGEKVEIKGGNLEVLDYLIPIPIPIQIATIQYLGSFANTYNQNSKCILIALVVLFMCSTWLLSYLEQMVIFCLFLQLWMLAGNIVHNIYHSTF